MLAVNHATLATASAFGYSLYFDKPFFLPLILFVVFAGVFPDIDHPGSELGKWFKPVATILPHRGVTHSILGTGIFAGGLFFTLSNNQYFTYILIFAGIFGTYLLEKILHKNINRIDELTLNFVSRKQIAVLIKISTLVLYTFLISLVFVAWNEVLRIQVLDLLVIGYVAHIVGDFITIEGVPIFYPIRKKIGLKLFRTGSKTEAFVGFCLVILNIYLLTELNIKYEFGSLSYWQNNLTL